MAKKKDLKATVERQLSEMLDSPDEPSEGRMKLLAIALKKLALDAKLEESEYGGFFNDNEPGDTSGISEPERKKPAGGKRANGGGET